jgi:hypothetical protein
MQNFADAPLYITRISCDNLSVNLKRKSNITFSVNAELLQDARKKAADLEISLNDAFLEWLEQFTRGSRKSARVEKLFQDLSHVNAGRKFDREESYE